MMPHALYKLSKNKKVMHLVRTAQGTVKKVKALALKEAKAMRNPIVIVRHKGKGSLPVRVKVVSNPFEAGLNRSWYGKGARAARSGKYGDDNSKAWKAQSSKPKIAGAYTTAQESFYVGFNDAWTPASARRRKGGTFGS